MYFIDKVKNLDWIKTFFASGSLLVILLSCGFIGYIIFNYVQVDLSKANKYINSKFFGSFTNIIILYASIFGFDSIYPGHTLSTLLRIDQNSPPEDKKNATYIMCAAFIATAWIISYQ